MCECVKCLVQVLLYYIKSCLINYKHITSNIKTNTVLNEEKNYLRNSFSKMKTIVDNPRPTTMIIKAIKTDINIHMYI